MEAIAQNQYFFDSLSITTLVPVIRDIVILNLEERLYAI